MRNKILWISAIIFALAALLPVIDWVRLDLTRIELFKQYYFLELIGFIGCIVCLSKIKKDE